MNGLKMAITVTVCAFLVVMAGANTIEIEHKDGGPMTVAIKVLPEIDVEEGDEMCFSQDSNILMPDSEEMYEYLSDVFGYVDIPNIPDPSDKKE